MDKLIAALSLVAFVAASGFAGKITGEGEVDLTYPMPPAKWTFHACRDRNNSDRPCGLHKTPEYEEFWSEHNPRP